jgi:nitrogen fixation/metabolism regulation signal transduction histidine kinase
VSAPPENVVQELLAALGRVRRGDLHASVSFADEDGEIGRLGREFNETVRELRGRRAGVDPKAISRLVHDIKNPLAGIAGVLEIIAQDLPQGSQAREVMPEVKAEIERIKQVLAEFAGK